MATEKVPIVLLAGSDCRPGPVPAGGGSLHFVVGYKAADFQVGGRPLIDLVVERVRQSQAFGDIYVAGPGRIYDGIVDASIIDTDGHIGKNIHSAVDTVQERHGRDTAVAFMASDVLPTPKELADLSSALVGDTPETGERDQRSALALSLVPASEPLGAASWKPEYCLRRHANSAPTRYLPGHLVVARPAMFRMGLFYRLIDLIYQQRNLKFEARRRFIVSRLVRSLLWRDLRNVLRLAPPTLTYTVLRHGLRGFLSWRRGELSIDGCARAIARVTVHREQFRRLGDQAVRIVVTPHLSFAKDIDTAEEFEELLGKLEGDAT